MQEQQNNTAMVRFTLGDLLAGARTLLLPIAVVGGLVAAAKMFHGSASPSDGSLPFAAVPQECWLWALVGYLAVILPRHPLLLRIPALPPLGKALICAAAGTGFLLELKFHAVMAPFMGTALAMIFAVVCSVSAGFIIRAERLRREGAVRGKDRALEQMIREFERLHQQELPDPAVTHPALFAEISVIVRPRSPFGASIWFLRPHPALDHRRPIDVLQEQGGEDKLLRACKLGPNS